MKRISLVISVNEEKNIGRIIKSASSSPIVSEIIVINDGATDKIKRIIADLKKTYHIIDISIPESKGKGYAIALGVECCKNEILVLIDDNHRMIQHSHIYQLVSPLFKNECDLVLSYYTSNITSQNIYPFSTLHGEKALFKHDLIPIIDEMKSSKMELGLLLYHHYLKNCRSMKIIYQNK